MKIILGRDYELRLVKILKFKLSRNDDGWLKFWIWCLVEILKMQLDQDFFLNLLYELNPRVRCAFGDVFNFISLEFGCSYKSFWAAIRLSKCLARLLLNAGPLGVTNTVCLLSFTNLAIAIVPVSNEEAIVLYRLNSYITTSHFQSMVSIRCLPLILSFAELNERLYKGGPNASGMRHDL